MTELAEPHTDSERQTDGDDAVADKDTMLSIRLPGELVKTMKRLGTREDRSVASMARTLIREALKARGEPLTPDKPDRKK